MKRTGPSNMAEGIAFHRVIESATPEGERIFYDPICHPFPEHIMEGLHMYLMPGIVDEIRSLIVKNSGKGSAIIFDYCPQSVVNGSCELVVGKNIHDGLTKSGLTKRVFFPWDQRRTSSMQPIVFKPVQWSNKSDGSS